MTVANAMVADGRSFLSGRDHLQLPVLPSLHAKRSPGTKELLGQPQVACLQGQSQFLCLCNLEAVTLP